LVAVVRLPEGHRAAVIKKVTFRSEFRMPHPAVSWAWMCLAVPLWESASFIKTSITKRKKGFEKRQCFDGWETEAEAAAAAPLHFKLETGK
jgi:hypothetical protein